MGTPLSPYSPSAVRSNLIPSPPTYNIAHDYISWESFSNVSYYTRILPSVPQDCPTPMGTKGNGDGVGSHRRCPVLFGEKQVKKQLLTHFPDGWSKAIHTTYQNHGQGQGWGMRIGRGGGDSCLWSPKKSVAESD